MLITKQTYQATLNHLDEIQENCAQGISGRNARECLMEVSAIIYQIRTELNNGITLEDGE